MMKILFKILFCLLYINQVSAAYIFFKYNGEECKPLEDAEFSLASQVLATIEFTHLQEKRQNDSLAAEEKITLNRHFEDGKQPFYEEKLIQEKLDIECPGIYVSYVPDTIAQLFIIKQTKETYTNSRKTIIDDTNFNNILNFLNFEKLKNFTFLIDISLDANHMTRDAFFRKYEDLFKIIIDETFDPAIFVVGTRNPDDIKQTILNMIKAELLSQYDSSLLLVRSFVTKELEGKTIFDTVYWEGQTYGLSYNFSLFAGYFSDAGASTYKLSLRDRQVLHTLFVPKTHESKNQFDLFHLPNHNPLYVVFERGEHFHPRTHGRRSAGISTARVVRSQTPVAYHDIHREVFRNACLNGYILDESLLTEDEKRKYNDGDTDYYEKHLLEEKTKQRVPSKIKNYTQTSQFKDAKCIDLSLLSAEEQAEYLQLKSKIALTSLQSVRLGELGAQVESEPIDGRLTYEEIKRHIERKLPQNNFRGNEGDQLLKNEDYIVLPLLRLLAYNTIILSIEAKPIDAEMHLPTVYGHPFASELAQNHKDYYARELKRSKQRNYVRQLTEARIRSRTPDHTDEILFSESPASYRISKQQAIKRQIANLDLIMDRMRKEEKPIPENYTQELKALTQEREDVGS